MRTNAESVGLPSAIAAEYVLGAQDEIRIWALGMEEISEKPVRVDPSGFVDLPVVGRLMVAGLTVDQLKQSLIQRLRAELHDPRVSVQIVEYGSQPVSILGAVSHPGTHQLRGRKTLVEALSLAGGLRPDAGHAIKITRVQESGLIPLPGAKVDPTGKFNVAEVKLKDVMAATQPAENILIRPHDVVTVPTAEMIYVMGAVRKPGAFVLNERESVSVLQALSMAEGLGVAPSPQNSRILRRQDGISGRQEVSVDLRKVLDGRAPDVSLQANDILFVPTSTPKRAAARMLEATIQTATGLVIWRRP